MGERIDGYDFDTFERPRRVSPYPVDAWSDGSTWLIWRGVDYDGPVKNMQGRLHYYASERFMSVQTRAVREDEREGIVFRFVSRGPRRETGVGHGG